MTFNPPYAVVGQTNMLLGLSSILILVLTAGFFVAAEYSLVSVRKTRIEQLVSEGNIGAGRVKHALEHLDRYIAAVQIGITLATLGLGALGEPVLADLLEPYLKAIMSPIEIYVTSAGVAVAVAFLIVTVLEIVLGEIVPKIFARRRAEGTVLVLIRPLELFVFIFRPLIWLVTFLSNIVLRLMRLNLNDEHGSVYSIEELEMLVVSSRKAGVLDRNEEVILRRVFDFGDLKTREVMRPRTEIEAIPLEATLPEVVKAVSEYRYSRLPVYDGDLDHIVGVLHVKDLFLLLAGAYRTQLAGDNGSINQQPANGAFNMSTLMRPIVAVPETLDVGELLNLMRVDRRQMVVAIDEYGGTAGIVTLEDVVEEIVGEVRDEFEPLGIHAENIVVTPNGTLVNGLTSIDDVNDALGLNIESEADTIGGYVFEVLGRKPELGDEIRHAGFTFYVEALDGLRIAKVRITQKPTQTERIQDGMEVTADET